MFEIKTLDDKNYAIRIIPSFKDFVKAKYGKGWDDFLRLKQADKEQILLRWKWGSSNDASNEECESTERYLMREMNDQSLGDFPPSEALFWRTKLTFNKHCNELRNEMYKSDRARNQVWS